MAGGASGGSQWSVQKKPPVDALNGAARYVLRCAVMAWLAAGGE